MRESAVRKALHKRIELLGGECRSLKYLGRMHATDDLVLLPGRHVFVEGKRPDEVARDGQQREHDRLRWAGCEVLVINTLELIDHHFPLPT